MNGANHTCNILKLQSTAILSDQYELDDVLGHGAFGQVHTCTHKTTGKVCSPMFWNWLAQALHMCATGLHVQCPKTRLPAASDTGAAAVRTLTCVHQCILAMQKYACKIIQKKLALPNVTGTQQARHAGNIYREVRPASQHRVPAFHASGRGVLTTMA